jgi:leucine dehydrogenase
VDTLSIPRAGGASERTTAGQAGGDQAGGDQAGGDQAGGGQAGGGQAGGVAEFEQPQPPLLLPSGFPLGEELVLCHDRATGLLAVIAIDDTTLGPGLGGVRWMPYATFADAVEEAARLSQVMTLKNAVADIPYGGAKSVILRKGSAAEQPERREAQLLAFGTYVNRLGGAYVPGVDMGTSVADLAMIGTVAPWVSCNHNDPSPATALGVFHSIEAAVRHSLRRDLSGVRVTVQGAGHVGSALAALLADRDAIVSVADVDRRRAAQVAHEIGGCVVAPDAAHALPCDVFAPCASARVLHPTAIDELRCALVVGAANDVLAERSGAARLARRGITYVPDFVSNAGGVLQIHAERAGWDASRLALALDAVGRRTTDLLDESDRGGALPLVVAEQWASDRVGRTVTIPD